MSQEILVKAINYTMIPILRELHWTGKLNIFLNKGYVTLQLTKEERAKFKFDDFSISEIEKILQSQVDASKSELLKEKLLKNLSTSQINIPNYKIKKKDLLDELQKETEEITNNLKIIIQPMVQAFVNNNIEELEKLLNNWQARSIRNVYVRGAELFLSEVNKQGKEFNLPSYGILKTESSHVTSLYIVINFYKKKKPDNKLIELFRELLLLENEDITLAIDYCMYRYWKRYPGIMYTLIKPWIQSRVPYLLDWSIHGIENPGRVDCKEALRFLKPIYQIKEGDTPWLLPHVMGTIISADPYESLKELQYWVIEENNTEIEEIIKSAIENVVKDKIINKSLQEGDFPNLEEVIPSIMNQWIKENNKRLETIGSFVLNFV